MNASTTTRWKQLDDACQIRSFETTDPNDTTPDIWYQLAHSCWALGRDAVMAGRATAYARRLERYVTRAFAPLVFVLVALAGCASLKTREVAPMTPTKVLIQNNRDDAVVVSLRSNALEYELATVPAMTSQMILTDHVGPDRHVVITFRSARDGTWRSRDLEVPVGRMIEISAEPLFLSSFARVRQR